MPSACGKLIVSWFRFLILLHFFLMCTFFEFLWKVATGQISDFILYTDPGKAQFEMTSLLWFSLKSGMLVCNTDSYSASSL